MERTTEQQKGHEVNHADGREQPPSYTPPPPPPSSYNLRLILRDVAATGNEVQSKQSGSENNELPPDYTPLDDHKVQSESTSSTPADENENDPIGTIWNDFFNEFNNLWTGAASGMQDIKRELNQAYNDATIDVANAKFELGRGLNGAKADIENGIRGAAGDIGKEINIARIDISKAFEEFRQEMERAISLFTGYSSVSENEPTTSYPSDVDYNRGDTNNFKEKMT